MRVVALVSTESHPLVQYLADVGFEVQAYPTPLGAPRAGTLVWVVDPESDARTVIDTLRIWLGAQTTLRAIVVTERPARVKQAVEDSNGRVLILAAPVFGWQLVDALRDETFAVS